MNDEKLEFFIEHAKKFAPFGGQIPLEPASRYYLTQALGSIMSEISEETWRARWLMNCENIIPFGDPDTCPVPELLNAAKAIAEILGHWANYEWLEDVGDVYIPHKPIKPGYMQTHSE